MKYKIFGCKVNKYYTDKWLASEYLKDKSGIFIATCVVTDKAKKKWVKFVKDEINKLGNNEKVYISGCGTIKSGKLQNDFYDLYSNLKEYKNKIELLKESPKDIDLQNNIGKLKGKLSESQSQIGGMFGGKLSNNFFVNLPKNLYTKKFILIQSGCDNYCAFCLTILKRGKHFFRQKEKILKDILEFEKDGGKEVVLTGINLGAWGLENTNDYKNSKLGELLEYILENSKIGRIRLSSLGPEFIDDKCLHLFKNKRIYPHFHFSVQSGSTDILKKMNRNYDGNYVENILLKTKKIKREDNVDVSLGADIIIGFPSETEKNFEKTYNLVKKVGIQKIHYFPFSPHKTGESVPAGNFPDQVDEKIKQQRLKKINDLSSKIRENFKLSQIGKTFEVLIESVKKGNFKGWTQNYIETNNENFEIISGEIKRNEVVVGRLK